MTVKLFLMITNVNTTCPVFTYIFDIQYYNSIHFALGRIKNFIFLRKYKNKLYTKLNSQNIKLPTYFMSLPQYIMFIFCNIL